VTIPAERLSRLVSHALRHEPWLYELELDDEGWVQIDDLVDALRRDLADRTVQRSDLVEMVAHATKQRHEIEGDRIRALYGHSLPGRITKTQAEPPPFLFHGTVRDNVPSILKVGLSPMGRQYVHLSIDRETAQAVGRRKGAQVVVLTVAAGVAHAAGTVFLRGNAAVWLAEQVPAAFIRSI
jgi:putative RNA 2'-phosphotransferase